MSKSSGGEREDLPSNEAAELDPTSQKATVPNPPDVKYFEVEEREKEAISSNLKRKKLPPTEAAVELNPSLQVATSEEVDYPKVEKREKEALPGKPERKNLPPVEELNPPSQEGTSEATNPSPPEVMYFEVEECEKGALPGNLKRKNSPPSQAAGELDPSSQKENSGATNSELPKQKSPEDTEAEKEARPSMVERKGSPFTEEPANLDPSSKEVISETLNSDLPKQKSSGDAELEKESMPPSILERKNLPPTEDSAKFESTSEQPISELKPAPTKKKSAGEKGKVRIRNKLLGKRKQSPFTAAATKTADPASQEAVSESTNINPPKKMYSAKKPPPFRHRLFSMPSAGQKKRSKGQRQEKGSSRNVPYIGEDLTRGSVAELVLRKIGKLDERRVKDYPPGGLKQGEEEPSASDDLDTNNDSSQDKGIRSDQQDSGSGGEEAVNRGQPEADQEHSESGDEEEEVRKRQRIWSEPKVYLRPTVMPQRRPFEKGDTVCVISGHHKGRIGKISKLIGGGRMWFVVESDDGGMCTVSDQEIRPSTSLDEEDRSTQGNTLTTKKRAMKRAKAVFLDALCHEFLGPIGEAKKEAQELLDKYRSTEYRLSSKPGASLNSEEHEQYLTEAEAARKELKAKEKEIFGDSTSYATAQIYANDAFKELFGGLSQHRKPSQTG